MRFTSSLACGAVLFAPLRAPDAEAAAGAEDLALDGARGDAHVRGNLLVGVPGDVHGEDRRLTGRAHGSEHPQRLARLDGVVESVLVGEQRLGGAALVLGAGPVAPARRVETARLPLRARELEGL